MTIKTKIWLILIPAMLIQFIGAYFYFIAYAGSDFVVIIYTATKILMIVFPIVGYFLLRENLPKFFTKEGLKNSIIEGLIVSGVIILSMAIAFYFLQPFVMPYASYIDSKIVDFGIKKSFWVFAIFFSIFHSLFEEFYWRWFVFSGLKNVMPWKWAIVLSSIAFASHHFIIVSAFVPLGLAMVFGVFPLVAGIFWCWQYQRTENIIAPWLSHIVADLMLMVIGYLIVF